MPQVPQQRGPAPASCPGVKPCQLHADSGPAAGSGTLVADHDPGETGQDRGQGRRSWPLRRLPDGRGRRASRSVPGHPTTDRPTSKTNPGDGLNGEKVKMAEGEVRPNEVESDRNRVPNAVRWSKAWSCGRECSSRFHAGACSATIGAEFGSYLGNVGSNRRVVQTFESF